MYSLLKFHSAVVCGYASKKLVCRVEYSQSTFQLLKILRRSGFIYGFRLDGLEFYVYLRYLTGNPAMAGFKFMSKPGKRIHIRSTELRKLGKKFPSSVHVISTSTGLKVYPYTVVDCKKTATPTGEYLLRLW